MKLNEYNITISEFTEETIENEKIIFVEDYHKIIVLNPTASTIWNYIYENYQKNNNISYDDIVTVLKNNFLVSSINAEELFNDIKDTVLQLIEAKIIVKESEGIKLNETIL